MLLTKNYKSANGALAERSPHLKAVLVSFIKWEAVVIKIELVQPLKKIFDCKILNQKLDSSYKFGSRLGPLKAERVFQEA